jgi:hypothetical protein
LPIVLHGYETWYLTVREECRLRVCENRVLRRIFGPKWDEVLGRMIVKWIFIKWDLGLGGMDWIDLA